MQLSVRNSLSNLIDFTNAPQSIGGSFAARSTLLVNTSTLYCANNRRNSELRCETKVRLLLDSNKFRSPDIPLENGQDRAFRKLGCEPKRVRFFVSRSQACLRSHEFNPSAREAARGTSPLSCSPARHRLRQRSCLCSDRGKPARDFGSWHCLFPLLRRRPFCGSLRHGYAFRIRVHGPGRFAATRSASRGVG